MPRSIRERKLGIPVSSQATSSQSMMALLTGTRASAGRNDLNRLVMSAPFLVKRSGAGFDVHLGAPAVEFNFVQPFGTGRRDLGQGRRHRLNKVFTQDAADVGTLAGGVQERLIVSSEDRTYH